MSDKLLREAHQYLPEPHQVKAFSTEEFLYGLREPAHIYSAETAERLERLCKKAEVPKRLVVEYSCDLSKTIDTKPVAPEYAAYFTVLLLVLASGKNDFKYLNCAFKLIDGGLREPKFSLPEAVHKYAGVVFDKLFVTVR